MRLADKRHELYKAILSVVRSFGKDMPVGEVRVALNEVQGALSSSANNITVAELDERLKGKEWHFEK